jgi:uncharacterized protein (TIGR03067 family)
MRPVVLSVLLLSASAALSAPAPFPKAERQDDLARLRGEWAQEAVHVWQPNGWTPFVHQSPADMTVQGNRMVYRAAVETFYLRGGSPRGIDITSDATVGVSPGVYSIEDDTLTIVLGRQGEPRPASLDEGNVKVVYRRKR